jgi:Protein of unknown function (DUF2868)
VTIARFDKRVLIEQIRSIEAVRSLVCDDQADPPNYFVHHNFEDRLWQRACRLVDCNRLRPAIERVARLSSLYGVFALILTAVLGATGVSVAVSDGQTINVYWLLLVLLGFNFASMLLWLAGISLKLGGLTSGVLARITSWLPDRLRSRSAQGIQADRAWLACHFGGQAGKWRFSKITHQLWLCYLTAGMITLTLILTVRQYDFVWATTLLSDSAFVHLTDTMSTPLHALGLATPTADQVQATKIGGPHALTADQRSHWAQFLLGALLCYGIVPRMLLWVWSALMSRAARRRFTLDYYLPYYISLRQELMPLSGHGQIIDADTSPPGIIAAPTFNPAPHKLPAETQWVSVELGDDIRWPPDAVHAGNDMGQVIDRESLVRITLQLKQGANPIVAVAVAAARPADRGVQRTIASLLAGSAQSWLVLLQHQEHSAISPARLSAWYRLAEACKVPADHVISMTVA